MLIHTCTFVATLVTSSAVGTLLMYGLQGHGVLSTCMYCILFAHVMHVLVEAKDLIAILLDIPDCALFNSFGIWHLAFAVSNDL